MNLDLLPTRISNALKSNGLKTTEEACALPLKSLLIMRGVGSGGVQDLLFYALQNNIRPKWMEEFSSQITFDPSVIVVEAPEETSLREKQENERITSPYVVNERWMLLAAIAQLERSGIKWYLLADAKSPNRLCLARTGATVTSSSHEEE